MENNNYAVFILTNGRPDKIITYKTLRNQGYTGKIYLIIDDEDKTKDIYIKNYPKEIIIFSKKEYEDKFDIMDNFKDNKVIVYARNACYDIARKLKLKYFFEYEDDYENFGYRYIINKNILKNKKIHNLDLIYQSMIKFINNTKSHTIAFAQAGDYMTGASAFMQHNFKRKAMNTFLFKVNDNKDDDIKFIGRMNDDVNTYLSQGKIGKLFFQLKHICLQQLITQTNTGGNTESYKKYGTYVKSFYSIIAEPSCVKISMHGIKHKRIHHKIKWNNAVPVIIDEKYKKKI